VTDHGTVRGGLEARRGRVEGCTPIVGCEVRVEGCDILCLFVERDLGARTMGELVDEVRAMDGLLVLAHPYGRLSSRKRVEELGMLVDAIEALNGKVFPSILNRKAQELARRLGKPVTGGSDAHAANEVGVAYTVVEEPGEEGVRRAVLRGSTRTGGSTIAPWRRLPYYGERLLLALTGGPRPRPLHGSQ